MSRIRELWGGGVTGKMSENPKKMIFFPPFCLTLQLLQGGSAPTFLRDKTERGVIKLRRLSLCNFTPRDKQIKTYYLRGWSAVRQEIGSFSPLHRRMVSVRLPGFFNPINPPSPAPELPRGHEQLFFCFFLVGSKINTDERQTDNLALCHCKCLGQRADHS